MPARGYCTVAQVANALGRTFTAAQTIRADQLIESAELWIDRYTHRAYGVATITGEKHLVLGGWVTLNTRPITAITAITSTPYPFIDADATVLVSESTYQLMDATEGLLYVGDWLDGYLVSVSYTAPTTVPANVRDACIALVAQWLRPTVEGLSDDVASYSIAGDLSVTYRGATSEGWSGSIPATVYDLLGGRLVFS